MPKLYHNGAHWQVPGQQDKTAERVDVPASPVDLAAWLEARRVPAAAGPSPTLAELLEPELVAIQIVEQGAGAAELERAAAGRPSDRCEVCKARLIATTAGADKLAIGRELAAIGAWLDDAPAWAVARLRELLEERGR